MAQPLDVLLRAGADPIRLRLFNLLREGTVCVCDLQRVLGLAQPTVSRHLAVLRHAGLVTVRRSGNRMLYALAPADTPQLQAFLAFLQQCAGHEAIWQKDLRQLKAVLRGGECATDDVTSTLEATA